MGISTPYSCVCVRVYHCVGAKRSTSAGPGQIRCAVNGSSGAHCMLHLAVRSPVEKWSECKRVSEPHAVHPIPSRMPATSTYRLSLACAVIEHQQRSTNRSTMDYFLCPGCMVAITQVSEYCAHRIYCPQSMSTACTINNLYRYLGLRPVVPHKTYIRWAMEIIVL